MTPTTGSGIVVRTWNDAPISRRDCDGYADATAMCQANGKDWYDYQRLGRTSDYLQALADATGLAPAQLVISTTTGPNHLRGTWIHPRLAVDLARWLSPAFAVWMDGWFLEQTQQPQQAPQPQGDAWRSMDGAAWLAQPLALQAAQYLLTDAEQGGDRALSLFRARRRALDEGAQIVAELAPRRGRGRPPAGVHGLPPSGVAVLLLIHHLRQNGQFARTRDIWPALHDHYACETIRNRLTLLRAEGLIVKRGTGWHLTAAGARLASEAASESAA